MTIISDPFFFDKCALLISACLLIVTVGELVAGVIVVILAMREID